MKKKQNSNQRKEIISYWKMFNGAVLSNISYLLFYALGIYLANVLENPSEFGNYSVTVSTILFLSSLIIFGQNRYILRIYPEYLKKKRLDYIHGYLQRTIQVAAISGIIIVALTAVSYELYLRFSNPLHHHPIIVGILFTPIIALVIFFLEILNTNEKYYLSIFIKRIFLPIIAIILVFIFAKFRYISATSAVLATGIAWFICLLISALNLGGIRPILKSLPHYETKKWFTEAAPYWFYQLMILGGNVLAIIMIEIIHPNEGSVGLFAAAFQTASFIALLNTSSNRYLLPLIAAKLSDKNAVRDILQKRRNFMLFSAGFYLLIILVFGKYFLLLFGSDYVASYNALVILSLAFFVQTFFGILAYLLQYYDLSKQMIRAQIIYISLSLILYFALIPFFHGLGAAIAFLLSVIVATTYQVWVFYKNIGLLL